MKLHKIGILFIIILTALAFTSCENEEWVRARLDVTSINNPNTVTDRTLVFELYDTDIEGYNPRRDRIINMDLYESSLSLYSRDFRTGDRMDIILETSAGSYLELRNMTVDGNRVVYIDSRDRSYSNFMYDVANQTINNGYITLSLYVDHYDASRLLIDEIKILTDLDLYID